MKRLLFFLALMGLAFAQEYSVYDQAPPVRMVCYGESRQVVQSLRTGANLCSSIATLPNAPDIEEVHYVVRMHYLNPSGQSQVEEFVFRQSPRNEPHRVIDIPVYVPETNVFNGLFRIFGRAFEAVIVDGYRATRVALAVNDPTMLTVAGGIANGKALIEDNRTAKFFNETFSVLDDLLGQKNRPYMVQVFSRICSLERCSPWGGVGVRL